MIKKREGGFIALTSVLIIGAIVLILGISLFHSALTDYSISTAYESGQQAAFLADFCLAEGMLRLKENIDYRGGEEIKFNDMVCSIGLVEDVDGNTKKVSSLGRAGDQPHFSRSSQLIRYVIESSAEDWENPEAELSEYLKIKGDLLTLEPPAVEDITRTTPSEEWPWENWQEADKVKVEGGALMLDIVSEKKPDGEPCISDEECMSAFCYRDNDGDRYYVIPSDGIMHCQANSALGVDCYDKNANARPGQTGWFTTKRGTSALGNDAAGNTWDSYDYNCDGTVTKDTTYCKGTTICSTSGIQYSCYFYGEYSCDIFIYYAYSNCSATSEIEHDCGVSWTRKYCSGRYCMGFADCTQIYGAKTCNSSSRTCRCN